MPCVKTYIIELQPNCCLLLHELECNIKTYWTSVKGVSDKGVVVSDGTSNMFVPKNEIVTDYGDDFCAWASSISDQQKACQLTGGEATSELPPTKQDTEYIECFRVSDCKKVKIEICTFSDGSQIIIDLDSNAIITKAQLVSDYSTEPVDHFQDIKEYSVTVGTGVASETVTYSDKADAVRIQNCSPCDMIARISFEDKEGNTKQRIIKLKAGETKVPDWINDVVTSVEVGECPVLSGVVDLDNLTFVPASQDLETVITFFNS